MIRAYHFVGATLRDGRPVPADGEWLEHDGPLVMCASGLHASVHPFDALQYAPGSTLCLVEIDGEMVQQDDKVVARRRRIVRRIDATDLLRGFARACARDVLPLWEASDVVRRYLETGDESIRAAAWDAARAAATAAAWDSARAAATAAVWDAAKDAASAAATAAAWDSAARDAAARAAAWDVARDAARAAARTAAWDAARQQQRDRFAQLVTEAGL